MAQGRNRNNRGSGEYDGFGAFDRDSFAGVEDPELEGFDDLDMYEGFDNYERYGDQYDDIYDDPYEDDYDPEYDEGYDEGYVYEGDDDYGRRRSSGSRRRSAPASRGKSRSRSGGRGGSSRGRSSGRQASKSRGAADHRSSRKSGRGGGGDRRGGGRKKKSRFVVFFIEILIFVLLLAALFFIIKWEDVNKTTLKESDIYINDELKEVLASTPEKGEEKVNWNMEGYKNIALFGVDAGKTRSDTIIIASINESTGEIKMCSVYRDTYLNVNTMESPTYAKANSAYAKGGPEQAIRMLNMNLDMNIDDFVTVDFQALEDIIDDLGGVEINVQPEEVDYINDYQFSIVMGLGGPKEGKITNPRNFTAVTEPGLQTLNGLQATAYCRIRYTAGADFRRTERQREVISQIIAKAKKNPGKLTKVMDDVLPKITTSFTGAEFAGYASKVASYTLGETRGFPFENVTGKIGGQSMVVPVTLSSNVNELHTFLFGASDYSPTTTVQTISDKVDSDRTQAGLN